MNGFESKNRLPEKDQKLLCENRAENVHNNMRKLHLILALISNQSSRYIIIYVHTYIIYAILIIIYTYIYICICRNLPFFSIFRERFIYKLISWIQSCVMSIRITCLYAYILRTYCVNNRNSIHFLAIFPVVVKIVRLNY